MADTFYKLPLDEQTDSDLIEWIGSLPRNKKAEVVRHALRFYKSHLSEGEVFYYPTHKTQVVEYNETANVVKSEKPKEKKRAPVGILTGITKTE